MFRIEFSNETQPRAQDIVFVFNAGQNLLVDSLNTVLNYAQLDEYGIRAGLENLCFIGKLSQSKDCGVWTALSSEVQRVHTTGRVEFTKMRSALGRLQALDPSLALVRAASRAAIISYWRRRRKFCGICADQLVLSTEELALYCTQCREYYYPQIAPAIIVAVVRRSAESKEILLIRNKRSASGYFSLVSGYVEAGESIEDAAHREIYEETGIKIHNLRYLCSQSWPFPHSQMLGFMADYESGEITIQEAELSDARWFTANALPDLPPPLSISSELIQCFIDS